MRLDYVLCEMLVRATPPLPVDGGDQGDD
jgi:hypothetical protein